MTETHWKCDAGVADEMAFSKPVEQDLWMNHVNKWRIQGSPGGSPPGVSQARPVNLTERTDYSARKPSYLLRPEVSFLSIASMSCCLPNP
jgi:hypothetical protein